MTLLEFRILGSLEVATDTGVLRPGRLRERKVLAVLLLNANKTVPVRRLVDALWDDGPPATAVKSVSNAVSQLRVDLGEGKAHRMIERVGIGYRLRVALQQVDAWRFEAAIVQADITADQGRITEAADLLGSALDIWRGPALAGMNGRIIEGGAAALDERRLMALERYHDLQLTLGRHSEVTGALKVLRADHPSRERMIAQLMLALYRSGQQGSALAVFRETRAFLACELGIEPGRELQRLNQRILVADPALAWDLGTVVRAPPGDQNHAGLSRDTRITPHQLPPTVQHFSGRTAQLSALTDMLNEGTSVSPAIVIAAITGTAGIGKTTLALHWSHRVPERFPDGQLYVNLRGFGPSTFPVTPTEALRDFIVAFGFPAERLPASLDALTGLYRSLLSGKRVLVVLDNARDADQVRLLLPGSPGCFVLITSRSQLGGLVAAEGARPLNLGVLSTAESHELLDRQLGPERAEEGRHSLAELIELCARLPLALSVTGARLAADPRLSPAELAAQLRSTKWRLDTLDSGEPVTSVRTVFSWSMRNLTDRAARLFRLLGLHPGPDISVQAAASLVGSTTDETLRALAELTSAHLLTAHPRGRYSFHDLLRLYAAEQAHSIDSEDERRLAIHRVLDHYLHTAHAATLLCDRPVLDSPLLDAPVPGVIPEQIQGHDEALAWFQLERSVLLASIDLASAHGFDFHVWQLAWALNRFLDMQGHWHTWAATQQAALDAACRLANLAAQAWAHLYLGRAHTRLGNYAHAHAHFENALKRYDESGDCSGKALTHLNFCLALANQGAPVAALDHAKCALLLYQALGHSNGQANAYNDIGALQTQLGEYKSAVTSSQLALALSQQSSDRFCQACAWDSLGCAQYYLGLHYSALICYEQALQLFQSLGDRLNESEVLAHLGDTYYSLGDGGAARDAWRQALAIRGELSPLELPVD